MKSFCLQARFGDLTGNFCSFAMGLHCEALLCDRQELAFACIAIITMCLGRLLTSAHAVVKLLFFQRGILPQSQISSC